ncbi:hypothetical protein [Pseudoalteromonas luteoviolacea]|uniref:Uncharacterized protein n=1 Tax=Pseudoalteromonas luteoviolacea (strain 2ta16) TaxID=1353533 RepID=V4H3Z9_PSEL2|nr:hypothetical protein [Pseudoalteromonas luteoviolacea]ESP92211.1 hypothetical protein PL2TA16_05048 [Pseudoalteromonas luteoviolacea 2ta16]KZN29319.1 hypothetical protein N483_07745 [Pseudoalteromonas luteoviolacea NCIMB 1944]
MINKKALFAITFSLLSFNSLAAMSLVEYQHRAYTETGRCLSNYPNYQLAINYAQQKGLISENAAQWARATGYYPVIGFFGNQIVAVCRHRF